MNDGDFFHVGRLIPLEQDLVTIGPGTPVAEALAIMRSHEFDQLPVVADGRVVGVFTYRSLAFGLANVRRQDDPRHVAVDDLLEDLRFVRASEEVGPIIDHLNRDGAVLVGDEEKLRAVATASDVTSFLWEATRPFVLLQDIELAVRELMRSACSTAALAESIELAMPTPSGRPVTSLEDLSLGEALGVLTNGSNFGQHFHRTFGKNRELVLSRLEPVRDIRNKVFHFRDDVKPEELELLVETGRWLRRKVWMKGARRE